MVKFEKTEPPPKQQNTMRVSSTFTSQVGRFNSLVWHRLGLVFGTKLSVRSSSAVSLSVWRDWVSSAPLGLAGVQQFQLHGGSRNGSACTLNSRRPLISVGDNIVHYCKHFWFLIRTTTTTSTTTKSTDAWLINKYWSTAHIVII